MATKRLEPVHPGHILAHDFMEPLNLTSYRMARDIGVSVPTVNQIKLGRRAITAEMALRLSHYFGTTAQLWLNLQAQYDLEVAGAKIGGAIARIAAHPHARDGTLRA